MDGKELLLEPGSYLIFDVDDTLYDLKEPFAKAHTLLLKRKNIDEQSLCVDELFERSRVYSNIVLDAEYAGEIASEDAFHERIKRTYAEADIEISREDSIFFERDYREGQAQITLFPFMQEILECAGQRGIPCALLTNGNHNTQKKKIYTLGLERWIRPEHMFVSGDVGALKPDRKLFSFVQENLGVTSDQIWYFGDTYEADIMGGAQVGWHCVWFNHRRLACPDTKTRAEFIFEEKSAMADFLRKLIASANVVP